MQQLCPGPPALNKPLPQNMRTNEAAGCHQYSSLKTFDRIEGSAFRGGNPFMGGAPQAIYYTGQRVPRLLLLLTLSTQLD